MTSWVYVCCACGRVIAPGPAGGGHAPDCLQHPDAHLRSIAREEIDDALRKLKLRLGIS